MMMPLSAARAADACCPKDAAAPVNSAFAPPPSAPRSGELSEADVAFLAGYENVRAALAGDNFEAAQKAAEGLDGAEGIAAAKSIAEARQAFKALSVKAIGMAKGHKGFFVAHCPMVKGGGGDWLATKKAIENPYYGSQMYSCGTIKE